MRGFIEAARWLLPIMRHPVVFAPLLGWGVLTALVYFMTPIAPMVRFRPPPFEIDRSKAPIRWDIPQRIAGSMQAKLEFDGMSKIDKYLGMSAARQIRPSTPFCRAVAHVAVIT